MERWWFVCCLSDYKVACPEIHPRQDSESKVFGTMGEVSVVVFFFSYSYNSCQLFPDFFVISAGQQCRQCVEGK